LSVHTPGWRADENRRVYIDIYFTSELPVDRDDLEDALNELDGFEVVGAGVAVSGSNLDVEVDDSIRRAEVIDPS
jgi:hypothetical protein